MNNLNRFCHRLNPKACHITSTNADIIIIIIMTTIIAALVIIINPLPLIPPPTLGTKAEVPGGSSPLVQLYE